MRLAAWAGVVMVLVGSSAGAGQVGTLAEAGPPVCVGYADADVEQVVCSHTACMPGHPVVGFASLAADGGSSFSVKVSCVGPAGAVELSSCFLSVPATEVFGLASCALPQVPQVPGIYTVELAFTGPPVGPRPGGGSSGGGATTIN